ncbi:YY1-associated factor 2 isoform X1 [Delphinapterus leucas]|uniref:YY1-associated factor 2 isoform X1 n=1 Tax=Delphinapterus leucas TaxID=9749 RepID=A0A2Y9N9M7_DELLE|nr:YY1-associated factor 2 isoform X1 [Delphinapterus leucas]
MESRWRRPERQLGVSERRWRRRRRRRLLLLLRPGSRPRLPDSLPPSSRSLARWGPAGLGSRDWGGGRGGRGRGARARPAGDPAPRRVRVVFCRPKRQPKPSSDEGYWDCSVCTFRNSAEAFKCMMCDVRKGTSTRSTFFEVIVNASRTKGPLKFPISGRKPRPVSQLVAQQVTQQFVPPTQSKKEKKDKVEKEKSEKETTSKKNSHKKTRPRLKNVDRSSAQHLEVTVGDLTVIITDFKEKTKSPPASSAASADQHSQSGSSSDNTERGMSRSSSPRGEASSLNGESH